MPLTSEVRLSPEPSARPSATADTEERQICTTCLFAESVGLCLCFLPSCAMYKDWQRCCKRGSGDGQRLSLDYGTTERSFNAVGIRRRGSTLTWTVCTAADSEERQICTTCLFAESVGLWKRRRSYLYVCFLIVCFLPSWSWSTLLFERGLGEEGRFDVASRSQTPKTSCQNHKQQLLRPRSGPSKVAHTRTTGLKNSK